MKTYLQGKVRKLIYSRVFIKQEIGLNLDNLKRNCNQYLQM